MAQYTPAFEERRVGVPGMFFLPFYLATIVTVLLLLAKFGPEEIRATVIILVLTPLTLMIFARAARADPDGEFLYKVLLLSWPAKLAGMGFKLYLLFQVFHTSDALGYHGAGQNIAAILASGGVPEIHKWTSTEFVNLVTGLFYFVTGPTFVGAWIFWSWLAHLGMLAHYKAFVTALPNAGRRWLAVPLFLSPTILFWTNALGKDALIALGLGLSAYGVAQVYRRGLGLGPLLWTLAGLGFSFLVRPHMGAVVAAAVAGAVLLRPIRAGLLTPVIRIGTFAAMAVLAVIVLRMAADAVSLELSVEGVQEFFETKSEGSAQGSTEFESVGTFPTTPQAFVLAVVTVLFRPFPWETDTLLGLGMAVEGMILIVLLLFRWRSFLSAIWEARRHAYLTFVTIYAALFIILFSSVSNFGILVRQRAQLLPFLFVLVAYRGSRRDALLSGPAE